MIEIYGVDLSVLPARHTLVECLRPALYEAWLTVHEGLRGKITAKGSLAGLFLLEHCLPNARLSYDTNGRPYAEGATVDFSITHTAEYTFLAINREGMTDFACVGIDAEDLSRLSATRNRPIAERWFSAGELAYFLREPTTRSFLQIWTRKEALVKWTGEGLRSLRNADTASAEEAYGVRFYEQWMGDTLVTVCSSDPAAQPAEIHMLSAAELCALGLCCSETE